MSNKCFEDKKDKKIKCRGKSGVKIKNKHSFSGPRESLSWAEQDGKDKKDKKNKKNKKIKEKGEENKKNKENKGKGVGK